MSEEIAKVYISGEFSIIVAIVGFLGSITVAFIVAYSTSARENKKIQHKFIESLYEKLYETYTKLLEITQEIGKDKTQVELHENVRKELKRWQTKTGGFLLLSKNSLIEFNKLKDLLKKNPEKQVEYSENQRKKIFNARNSFRGALREDFEFFHSAEKKL